MANWGGSSQPDALTGTNEKDAIRGGQGNDVLRGGLGDDQLWGDEGDDLLQGDGGNDQLYGGAGQDRLEGGDGNDLLSKYLLPGASVLLGGAGDDMLWGGLDGDVLDGGDGDDWLEGFAGDDQIEGGAGNDRLWGYEGNDWLSGGAGDDQLYGGTGNDVLVGGEGHDLLHGGAGDDTYFINNTHQYIQDASGVDTAWVSANFAKIPSHIEHVHYIQGAQALPYWIDALLPDLAAGQRLAALLGADKSYAFAFPTVRPDYVIDPVYAQGWAPLSDVQQARVRQALDYVASVVDLKFVETASAAALKTISVASNSQTGSSGFAQFPSATSTAGSDVYLDNSAASPFNRELSEGSYGALVLIHELGHALGLKHPFSTGGADSEQTDPPFLSPGENKSAWTVMSYAISPAQYRLEYSALDLAALQYLYGPSKTARAGDDTYRVQGSTPNFIWDGAGVDTLSAADSPRGCTLYLTPGEWGFVGDTRGARITEPGQVTVNFGTTLENLVGSAHADHLHGNEVANRIVGGAGDDTLQGWGGDDVLDGGEGADVAVEQGRLGQYRIERRGDTWTVTDSVGGRDGVDTLRQIEHIRFEDSSIRTDMSQLARDVDPHILKQVIELYTTFFNGVPDADGLAHWLGQVQQGMGLADVAQGLYVQSAQHRDITGMSLQMRDTEFVDVVFRNVLGRDNSQADAEGRAYWTQALGQDDACSRGEAVLRMLDAAHASHDDATWGWVDSLLRNKVAVSQHLALDWGFCYLNVPHALRQGMALACAITPNDVHAALALVGLAEDMPMLY